MLISALYPLLLIARWEERMTVFVAGNDSKEVSDVRSAIKSNRTMFELEVVLFSFVERLVEFLRD